MTHESSLLDSVKSVFMRTAQRADEPLRVLVVDDEESIRTFADRVLRGAGYETVIASDGSEAIGRAMADSHFDLLLTDLIMPGMNGDEVARRLRRDEPDLRVLYLTGYSDRIFTDRSSLWEHEAFLEKPCTVKSLLQAVSLMMSGHI